MQLSKGVAVTPHTPCLHQLRRRLGRVQASTYENSAEVKTLGTRPITISWASVLSSKRRDTETQSQTDGCILPNWTLMKKSRFFCCGEKGIIA